MKTGVSNAAEVGLAGHEGKDQPGSKFGYRGGHRHHCLNRSGNKTRFNSGVSFLNSAIDVFCSALEGH